MELERITIQEAPQFTGFDLSAATHYFRAKLTAIPLLKKRVISPFETLLKDATGYSNENLPSGKQITDIECGNMEFRVTSEQRTKRPALVEVYSGTQDFLDFVSTGHADGVRRRGVRTFEDKPYIELSDVLTQVDELRAGVTTDEVKQSIKARTKANDNWPLIVPLTVPLELTESDAQLYINAQVLSNQLYNSAVKPFETALRSQTGYSRDNVPSEVKAKWVQVGHHLFEVQSIPEQTVRYAAVVDGLVKPAPERLTSRSKVGELVRLRERLPLDLGVREAYDLQEVSGKQYVSVSGIQDRLNSLKEENTNSSLNQRIAYFPAI